jgi:peptidoglycan/LPS O-acetylase OafA/YrhL
MNSALLGLLAACALLGLYAVLAGYAAPVGEHGWLLIAILMATVLWAAVSKHPPWGARLLGFGLLTFIGRVSYSMYLYHLPVLLLFNKFAPPAFAWLAFPCYFTAMVIVATASFRWIEQPFMRGPRRVPIPKPAAPSSAPATKLGDLPVD